MDSTQQEPNPTHSIIGNNVGNNVVGGNHNNNTKTDNIKSGVSLDACKLAKQSMPTTNNVPPKKPYVNISTGNEQEITGNGVIQNGPFTTPSALYINNTSSRHNDSEISC